MNRQMFVVIGAGLAGASAVSQLRKEGFDGAVVLVGEEPDPPYERPTLSKAFLRGEADSNSIAIRDPSFYPEHDVDLRLSTRAAGIRPASREVLLDDGSRLRYDRLLIATGSSPRRLDLPGHDLRGIHDLRTRTDSEAIRDEASRAPRAAVVGGGWIGSEVAASLRQLGLPVAMIAPDATPLERVLGPEIGSVFRDLHAEHGVDLELGQRVAGFEGSGSVDAVRTSDGRRIAADLVVVGIGVQPRVELAVEAGLDVSDGILVDECLESSVPGIFAAGDVAEMWHPALKTRLRVEHEDNAKRQGRAAARNMLGKAEPYDRLPYFYSDQYDLSMEYRGYAPAWDRVVTRGDLSKREFLAFWLADGRVIAAMSANVGDEGDGWPELVHANQIVDPERLADPDVPLSAGAADARDHVLRGFRQEEEGSRNIMPVRIASRDEVPEGTMRVFAFAGTRVNVTNTNGRFYAFDDTCTHAGCSLADGDLDGTTVTCACHGSQFDVTSGAVLRGPAQRPVRARAVTTEGEDLLAEA